VLIGIKQSISHTNARVTLDVLLGARLMLVAHMHNSRGLTAIHFVAEEAIKLLADLASCPANGSLLSRAVLAQNSSNLVAQTVLYHLRRPHIRRYGRLQCLGSLVRFLLLKFEFLQLGILWRLLLLHKILYTPLARVRFGRFFLILR